MDVRQPGPPYVPAPTTAADIVMRQLIRAYRLAGWRVECYPHPGVVTFVRRRQRCTFAVTERAEVE